jgi:hypothetical protein
MMVTRASNPLRWPFGTNIGSMSSLDIEGVTCFSSEDASSSGLGSGWIPSVVGRGVEIESTFG